MHILVVDDDARLRELLRQYLEREGLRVETAEDATAARAWLKKASFDLLVLDVMMPGETGLALLKDIRASSPVPILMLTAMDEVKDRIRGLEDGADDYLAKPFEPRELMLRIQAILRRASGKTEAKTLVFGAYRFDPVQGDLTRDGTSITLSTMELTLLRLLAGTPDQPVSREHIAAGMHGISDRSVDVQIARLRKKLSHAIRTVRGQGYMLRTGSSLPVAEEDHHQHRPG